LDKKFYHLIVLIKKTFINENSLLFNMIISLDQMLEFMPDLKPRKRDIQKTLDALDLQHGQRYLSVGIGKNRFPLLVALHGLEVTGFDIDQDSVVYQTNLSKCFAAHLQKVGGGLKVERLDIDATPLYDIPKEFDIIECVNFSHKYDEREIAQTLLALGNQQSTYLVSLFGNSLKENDKLAKSLKNEAQNLSKKVEINGNFFTSDIYPYCEGVLLKIY